VEVPPDRVQVDDGDTITIEWADGDVETVRILGIDTPETEHVPHNLPYDQPFGREAAAFAKGAFAVATKIELSRASTRDPFDRSLAYVFLNGRNYSELVLRARLAEESVSRYGDNGFPDEAAACLAAAREAGPLPFESPGAYRKRMREVSDWMRDHGLLPPLEEN
jgi:endonuclease YncB( thermonuclease family)